MEYKGCIVGNEVSVDAIAMNFHGGSKLAKLMYPIKTIYSKEARMKIKKVIDDFKPVV